MTEACSLGDIVDDIDPNDYEHKLEVYVGLATFACETQVTVDGHTFVVTMGESVFDGYDGETIYSGYKDEFA